METAVLIVGDDCARLEGDVVLASDAERAFDDLDVRPSEGAIDIAADHGRLPGDVARACAAFEQDLMLVPIGVNERRFGCERLGHAEHGRQRRDLDLDRSQRGLRLGKRAGGNRGQRLAVVADHLARE